jgi:uncharacterized protein YxeA
MNNKKAPADRGQDNGLKVDDDLKAFRKEGDDLDGVMKNMNVDNYNTVGIGTSSTLNIEPEVEEKRGYVKVDGKLGREISSIKAKI